MKDETEAGAPAGAETNETKVLCRNCGKKMAKKGSFCPHCGQKNIDGLEPFGKLLVRFLKSATHLDNKFVKMCWQLFLPAKVTLAWAQGKLKQYPHPVQFFFVVMFFFLLLMSRLINSMHLGSTSTRKEGDVVVSLEKKRPSQAREVGIFEALERYVHETSLKAAFDSLPPALQTEAGRQALDSVIRRTNGPIEGIIKDLRAAGQQADTMGVKTNLLDTLPFMFLNKQVRIATKDVVSLSADGILEKYKLTNWTERLLIKQGIKSLRDPIGMLRGYVGTLAWTILVHIAFMAFLMSVLYWTQKRYYVEHFVFLLHRHSGNFLLAVLLLLLGWAIDMPVWLWAVWLLYVIFSLPIALKRYYQQSWVWTLLKWFFMEIIGLFIFTVIFSTSFIVFLLIF